MHVYCTRERTRQTKTTQQNRTKQNGETNEEKQNHAHYKQPESNSKTKKRHAFE